jgi:demethylmenaquinone methyltransferase/2-methoxy-6-polyprenyl-1,4-benzoquinol methylase
MFSKDKNPLMVILSTSAANFPFGETLNNILRKISFIDCVALPQTFGVATIYTATKK